MITEIVLSPAPALFTPTAKSPVSARATPARPEWPSFSESQQT